MNSVFLRFLKSFESKSIYQNVRFQKGGTKKNSEKKEKRSQKSMDLQKEYEKSRSLQTIQKVEKSMFLEFLEGKENRFFKKKIFLLLEKIFAFFF